MDYKYVSIDRIFSKVIRDYGIDVSEGDVIEWTGEALEFIGAVKYYEEAVAFIEVKNHQFELPTWLHAVIQIARDNEWTPNVESNGCLTPKEVMANVSTWCKDPVAWSDGTKAPCPTSMKWNEATSEYILIDCKGTPVYGYEVAYYRPYYDLKSEYYGWTNSALYHRRFTPVRLSTSTLYNSLVCKEQTEYCCGDIRDEYTIIRGSTVRTSFKTGMVALSYLRQVVDEETGYPLIPDNISYTTAITKYIVLKSSEKEFYSHREGSDRVVAKAEADWQWYCGQASNVDKMPYGIDEHQNLLDQRQYIIPRQNDYYSFFGKLNVPENRTWNRNINYTAINNPHG